MDPRESVQVMPGCLIWVLLAGVFIFSGEWIDSIALAKRHPAMLGIVAVSMVFVSAWRTQMFEKRRILAFFPMMILTIITTAMVLAFIFAIAEFMPWGRYIVAAGPVLFLIALMISTIGFIGSSIADAIRKRR